MIVCLRIFKILLKFWTIQTSFKSYSLNKYYMSILRAKNTNNLRYLLLNKQDIGYHQHYPV